MDKGHLSLYEMTQIPIDVLEIISKLSDLTRLFAVKGVRAKLYLESGLDSVHKIAAVTPDHLVETVTEYISRTGFDGLPTLPKEAVFTVQFAKKIIASQAINFSFE